MKYEPGVQEALHAVRAMGQQDGKEHLILLREGERVLVKHGDDRMVDVTNEAHLFKQGDVIVHNHPELHSLSNQDIAMARTAEAATIYAIASDGSIFKGSTPLNPDHFMFVFEVNLYSMVDKLGSIAQQIPGFTDAVQDARHWTYLHLAKRGLMQYEFELGPETAKWYQALEEAAIVRGIL